MDEKEIREILGLKDEDIQKYIKKMNGNLSLLEKHIIPDNYPEEIEMSEYSLLPMLDEKIYRENIIRKSAFPLISKDWLSVLAEYLKGKKCLEIMAGSGMLTFALKEYGIDVIATDNKSWDMDGNIWTEIEELDAIKAVEKYIIERPFVIMSWPEMNHTAHEVVNKMRKLNPSARIVYIGEFGGCCADEDFVKDAENVQADFIKEINQKFKSWFGIHDLVLLLK